MTNATRENSTTQITNIFEIGGKSSKISLDSILYTSKIHSGIITERNLVLAKKKKNQLMQVSTIK